MLQDGIVTCSKDKRHTQVVDSFNMAETRVVKSDRGSKYIKFCVLVGSGAEAEVEFMAKSDPEVLISEHAPAHKTLDLFSDTIFLRIIQAETWLKLCGIARKWAEVSDDKIDLNWYAYHVHNDSPDLSPTSEQQTCQDGSHATLRRS